MLNCTADSQVREGVCYELELKLLFQNLKKYLVQWIANRGEYIEGDMHA